MAFMNRKKIGVVSLLAGIGLVMGQVYASTPGLDIRWKGSHNI